MTARARSWRPLADTVVDPAVPDGEGAAVEAPSGAVQTVVQEPIAEHEAHAGGGHGGGHEHHTSLGLSNNKLAMWLFLGSECLLFGGLIATYMLYRGRNNGHP